MPHPLLQLNEIQAFYGRVRALQNVSVRVDEGSVVALLGSNGAGKTTTLRVISGLLRPAGGTLEFDGKSVERLRADQLVRLGIGHVPEGRQLFPELTVRENLRIGAYTRSNPREIEQDIQRVFGYFPRLRDRVGQNAGTLSGGEQQMLAIGRALMSRPRLLLLDEPSLGLAPLMVKEIFQIISDIRSSGTTVVLVEQNAHMALHVSDYAYLLETGRVILSDTSDALRHREEVRRAYLGH